MKFRNIDLGQIPYSDAYVLQCDHVREVIDGNDPVLLLCEHPAILTLGRMTHRDNILFSDEQLRSKGVEIQTCNRGGDVTLHAPGQLVVYPIIDLKQRIKDLHRYMRDLEQIIIALLADFDIVAERSSDGNTGVWVGPEKIASMGVGVRKWVTFHGLALNVSTDLNLFSLIRPCGLDVGMTSMEKIQKQKILMTDVKKIIIQKFNDWLAGEK